mmetsp:Transcript_115177/g.199067  ORF Transcript_115177/g.199067 Transcript_115177/m.199067 type:complete len:664 (-) Transcript_115177:22-2013(-)
MNMMSMMSAFNEVVPPEVRLFLFAVIVHLLVFGTHRIRKRFPTNGVAKDKQHGASPQKPFQGSKYSTGACNPWAFASVAESISQNIADKESLAAKIRIELGQVPADQQVAALSTWIQEVAAHNSVTEDVLSVLNLMMEENDLQPSMSLGVRMALGYIGNHDMSQALQMIAKMRAAGRQPNLCSCNQLLDAAVKHCPKQVWTLIEDIKKCGVKPDRIMCSILLKTTPTDFAVYNLERIMVLVNNLHERMDEGLLTAVVEACLRSNRPDFLERHLRQHPIKYIQLKNPQTYGYLIRAYGALQNVKGVWDTWREMKIRRVAPDSVTLGCVVEALVQNGSVEAGYEFIRDVSKDEVCSGQINAVIYGSVLKGFAQQKKIERVWAVYQEMLELKLDFSIVTFNTLVDACARSHEMSKIPGLLKSMVAQGIEPNLITYSSILKGHCQANRLDEAFHLMEQMVQTTDLRPDEIMYNTLFDGCARQYLYDKGMEMLEEMQTFGVQPTNYTLSVVVKLASRCKRLDRAFELCEEISCKYNFQLNMHVYSNLIHSCVMNKEFPRGMDVFVQMLTKNIRPDARTYESLLRACVLEHRAQDAAGLLRAAVGLKHAHPKLVGRPTSLLQPTGRWTLEVVEKVLDLVAHAGNDVTLASEMAQAPGRVQGLRLGRWCK